MIGPVVGGLISGLIGIREIFWVGAIMMVINYLWVKKTLVSPALSGEAEAKPGSRERSN
jgi:DHA1 family multidrug resistance protein-like MFS transporter